MSTPGAGVGEWRREEAAQGTTPSPPHRLRMGEHISSMKNQGEENDGQTKTEDVCHDLIPVY